MNKNSYKHSIGFKLTAATRYPSGLRGTMVVVTLRAFTIKLLARIKILEHVLFP